MMALVLLVLRTLRQKGYLECKASLGCTVRSCLEEHPKDIRKVLQFRGGRVVQGKTMTLTEAQWCRKSMDDEDKLVCAVWRELGGKGLVPRAFSTT